MKDRLLYMKYIGIASLLGRLAENHRLSGADRDSVDRAFSDVNKIMLDAGSETRFERTSRGGWAQFD